MPQYNNNNDIIIRTVGICSFYNGPYHSTIHVSPVVFLNVSCTDVLRGGKRVEGGVDGVGAQLTLESFL